MQLRWGEAVLVLAWLATWLAALWWAGIHDPAGLLIPIVAAAALPRIFRQLHPTPTQLMPPPSLAQQAGRLLLGLGVVAALLAAVAMPPELPELTRQLAIEEVDAFIDAWEAEHGRPDSPEAWRAERAALDQFTAERVRSRKLDHERETARRLAARPLGMFGGAALAVLGMALASPRPLQRRRRRQDAEAAQASGVLPGSRLDSSKQPRSGWQRSGTVTESSGPQG